MQANHVAEKGKPRGCTNAKLRQVSRLMTQHYEQYMLECGVRVTQYSLLSTIQYFGASSPSDLARAMHMDNSTLTRNLRPLVDAGWVSLGPGDDLRSRKVELTSAGAALHQEARLLWRRAQEALNKKLGIAQVAQLHELLDLSLEKLQS
jgi:DNA-binding MarR family transcriptional regulator